MATKQVVELSKGMHITLSTVYLGTGHKTIGVGKLENMIALI